MYGYQRLYGVQLLDDIHNYFPAFLYDQGQFLTLTDVFRYLNHQMHSQFNLFSRGYAEYTRANPIPAPHYTQVRTAAATPAASGPRPTTARTTSTTNPINMTTTTETIDITPLFTTYLNPGSTFQRTGGLRTAGTTTVPTTHSEGFLAQAILSMLGGGLDPVVVRPTNEEISQGTSLRLATRTDEPDTCAICQDHYTEGQAIRTLTHCHHAFHKGCIDPWFERNVHCPVCRHDIREGISTDEL
jgi:hypothetical protein